MPRFAAHLGYLFTETPLENRFAAAAAGGFGAVEHPSPYSFGVDRFAGLAQEHGLAVAQVAAPSGDPARGEKGFACLPDRTAEFRESVLMGVAAAQTLSCPYLHIMPGVLPNGATRDELRQTYLHNLETAAHHCSMSGLTVLIEAISDETVPGFYVNDPRFAAELVTELRQPNVRLLFDAYHAAVKDVDPVAFCRAHLDLIGHLQIADHPGRHEPGSGAIPYPAFFDLLDRQGYRGWVGCEYKPAGATEDGLGWLPAQVSY